jgi:hypothetical protein
MNVKCCLVGLLCVIGCQLRAQIKIVPDTIQPVSVSDTLVRLKPRLNRIGDYFYLCTKLTTNHTQQPHQTTFYIHDYLIKYRGTKLPHTVKMELYTATEMEKMDAEQLRSAIQ